MMKTKILSFLVLICMVLIGTSAYAAGDQTPSPGQSETYSVTAGLTSYEWHIYQGTAASAGTTAATSAFTGSLGTSSSITVTWTAASAGNSYYIWVQGKDANGCLTAPVTYDITVGTATICIATGSTGEVGGDATAAPTGTNICSLIDNSPATTGATGGSYGSQTVFYATLTGGIPSTSYTVTYTISDGTTTETVTTAADLSTDTSGAGALAITITDTSYPAFFYASGDDKTLTITVTKVTSNSVDITNACASNGNQYTVTVQELPVIAF